MSLQATLLFLVVLLLLWLFIRRRASTAKTTNAPAPAIDSRQKKSAYHAVSIRFSSNACDAARAMEGDRILSSAAPRLPLPDCDVPECSCRFVHHKDRRSGRDRRSPFPVSGFGGGSGVFEKERRQGRDRRSQNNDDRY